MASRDGHLTGLDLLRVVALILVTAQHALTLNGLDAWTVIGGLSLGQIGVAIFLGVSGYLAVESRRPPVSWLVQRLRRLLPAYWIVIGASFMLAWATGHKRFDAWQVAAQLLGIGLFTHQDNLVNSPTWFISLLLACYAGTVAARLTRQPLLVATVASLT